MGRLTAIAVWTAGLVLFVCGLSAAYTPGQMSYQGYLTDSAGSGLYGTYQMVFALYDAPTEGNLLWEETQDVVVENGVYNVILGQLGNELTQSLFSGAVFLGITVGTDEEMAPRVELMATPFSINSGHADDADRLGGQDPTYYDQSAHQADTGNPHNVTANQVGAATQTDFTSLRAKFSDHVGDPSAHHAKTRSFKELTDQIADGQIPDAIARDSELAGKADIGHLHNTVYYTQAQVDAMTASLQSQIDELKTLLANVTRTGNDMYFSGVNVHIVSGSGSTAGTHNGYGNLIVGYNELRGEDDDRSGSHNIIVGSKHNYSSHGGLVVGYNNTISGPYASVSGGINGTASAYYASVSGGSQNTANGNYASVSGGYQNTASGNYAGVSGGFNNTASYYYASVSGGRDNTANGHSASVSGGRGNSAASSYGSVSGGSGNETNGEHAAISGGTNNTASGDESSISGGANNQAMGYAAYVGGGGGTNAADGNIAFADYSSILGGLNNLTGNGVRAYNDTLGRMVQTAITAYDHSIGMTSSISGGQINWTTGDQSSISGGYYSKAGGNRAAVSGGFYNSAYGDYSSVSGGYFNEAAGESASVTGGYQNNADGQYSSVSGGYNHTAANYADWRGGTFFADN